MARQTAAEFWRQFHIQANERGQANGAIPGYLVGSPFRETASAAWGEPPKPAKGVTWDRKADQFRPTDTIKPPPGIWNDPKPKSPWANLPPVRVGNTPTDKPNNTGERRSPWR